MIGIIGTVLVEVVFFSMSLVAVVAAVVVDIVVAAVVVVVLVRAVGHVSGAMVQTFLVQHSHTVVDT
jgi:hypothetical protein